MDDLDGLGTAEQAWTGAEVDALFAALDTEGLGRYGRVSRFLVSRCLVSAWSLRLAS